MRQFGPSGDTRRELMRILLAFLVGGFESDRGFLRIGIRRLPAESRLHFLLQTTTGVTTGGIGVGGLVLAVPHSPHLQSVVKVDLSPVSDNPSNE
jgi:uncharacterized membrane protein YfcA